MTSAYCCECLRGLSSSRAIRVVRALFTGLLLAAVAHAQCVTYGGTVTGTASANAIALNNAFSALSSPGGCIQFPSGTFTIDGSLVNAFSPPSASFSLTLVGTGTESTVLYFTGSNGITINATTATQTVHVRDLTFSTDGANSYTALTLNNTYPNISGQPVELSDISNTTFRGSDGPAKTYYWATAINVSGQSNINFNGDTFYGSNPVGSGNGIVLDGYDAAQRFGIYYNFSKCAFLWTGNGIKIANYIQGVTVTQSNFTNGITGILALNTSAGELSQLAITGGNQFEVVGNAIYSEGTIYGLIVNGNMILIDGEGATGNSGILLAGSGGLNSIVNNVFVGANDPPATTGYGIYVETPTGTTVVTGNSFHQLHEGVELYAASQWNVQANLYDNVTTHVANIGSNSVGVATQ